MLNHCTCVFKREEMSARAESKVAMVEPGHWDRDDHEAVGSNACVVEACNGWMCGVLLNVNVCMSVLQRTEI